MGQRCFCTLRMGGARIPLEAPAVGFALTESCAPGAASNSFLVRALSPGADASGGNFTENIDKAGGVGTSVFAKRPIAIDCKWAREAA